MQKEWLLFTSTKTTAGPFHPFTAKDVRGMFSDQRHGLCSGLVNDILASRDPEKGMEFLANLANPFWRLFHDFRRASEFKDGAAPQLFWIAIESVAMLDKQHTWEQYFKKALTAHDVKLHAWVAGIDDKGTMHVVAVCTNLPGQFDMHKRPLKSADVRDMFIEFFRYEGNVPYAAVGLQPADCIRVTSFDILTCRDNVAWATLTMLCSHITYLYRDNNQGLRWGGSEAFKCVLDFTTVQHNCFSSPFRAVFFPTRQETQLRALMADLADDSKRSQDWTPFLRSRCQSFPPMPSEMREFHENYGRYMGEFGVPWGALGFSCIISVNCEGVDTAKAFGEKLDLSANGLPFRAGWPLRKHAYHVVFAASRKTSKPVNTAMVRAAVEHLLVSIGEKIPNLGPTTLLSVVPLDPYTKRPALRQAMTPFLTKDMIGNMNKWLAPPQASPSIPKPLGSATGGIVMEAAGGAGALAAPFGLSGDAGASGTGKRLSPPPSGTNFDTVLAKRVKTEPGTPTAVSVVASPRLTSAGGASSGKETAVSVVASPRLTSAGGASSGKETAGGVVASPRLTSAGGASSGKETAGGGGSWDDFVRKGWNPLFYERFHAGFELCCDAAKYMGENIVKNAENGGAEKEIDCAAMKAHLDEAKSQLAACVSALDEAYTIVDNAGKMRGAQ